MFEDRPCAGTDYVSQDALERQAVKDDGRHESCLRSNSRREPASMLLAHSLYRPLTWVKP